jgi:hypothetical protein
VDEGNVPLHQRGEGFFGAVPGELFQQPVIRHIGHSPIICAPAAKPDKEFSVFRPLDRLLACVLGRNRLGYDNKVCLVKKVLVRLGPHEASLCH